MSHKPIAIPVEPGLVERTLRRFGYVKFRPASVIHKVETPVGVPGLDDIVPPPLAAGPGSRYAGVYMASPWVYVAVNRIAEAAALVPFRVYERRVYERATSPGPDGPTSPAHREQVRDPHPFTRLLDRPNPFLSRFELLEQTVGCLEIFGNAYWFLAGQPGGPPQELWPLRPDRVAIVPDSRRGVGGYIYEIDGQRVPLEPAEVVHFRRWHPANDYYGLSALEAARLAVESDRSMSDWNRRYFGEGLAVPAGIVAIRERVSDADFERLKREWRAAYGSGERKTAFLRGAAVEWHNVGLSQQDMDFLNARRFNREEIFQIFGIPVGMFSENATEANALVGERVFIERTLWPKLARIAEKITNDLLPFYPGDLVGRFDDIRPHDRSQWIAELHAARGILTVDELRARYFQMGPVEGRPVETHPAGTPPSPESAEPAATDGDSAPGEQPGDPITQTLPDTVQLAPGPGALRTAGNGAHPAED